MRKDHLCAVVGFGLLLLPAIGGCAPAATSEGRQMASPPALSLQQEGIAATMSDAELRQECLRWFGNTSYAGILKNDTYYYRFGRRVVYSFSTAGQIVREGDRIVCIVDGRYETDAKDSGTMANFRFDGTVAIWYKEGTRRVWTSFKPQGRCLWRDGMMVSDGFDKPVEGNFGRKSGEGYFCGQ